MGYLVFASLMIFLQAPPPRPLPSPRHLPPRSCCADCVAQVVPIAAAFILTVSAGAIFGGVKGTAMVLTCSTISASISFGVSRSFGRQLVLEAAQESPQCAALPAPPTPPPLPPHPTAPPQVSQLRARVRLPSPPRFKTLDDAFSNASYGTSLLLISLLRLSPVLPFSWANYIFGLSPVPFSAFSLGTFLGCFPAVSAYVNAGKLGAEIVVRRAARTAPPSRAPRAARGAAPLRCPAHRWRPRPRRPRADQLTLTLTPTLSLTLSLARSTGRRATTPSSWWASSPP